MKIIYASDQNLPAIAKCHMAAFPKSLTSMLGSEAVQSMLGWYLKDNNKFLFYVTDDTNPRLEVLGYCGGFIMDGRDIGSSTGMIQEGFNVLFKRIMAKPWLLFHPAIRKKYVFVFKNILRKIGVLQSTPAPKAKLQHQPLTAGLVVIGVLPNLQKMGLGSLLQQEFERKAITMGAKRLSLSVLKSNEKAIKSYLRNGYTVAVQDATALTMTKDI